MQEGAGKYVLDSSQYGNHGTIYGATWTDGKFGKALYFDGEDDYVEIPDDDSLDVGEGNFTLSLWIKVNSISAWTGLIDKHGWVGSYVKGYGLLFYPDDKVSLYIGDGTAYKNAVWFDLNLIGTGWHYLSVVRRDGTAELFVDSISKGIKSCFSGDASWPERHVLINSQKKLNGTIDEVRIYNRALTEDEIRAHYKGAAIKLRS